MRILVTGSSGVLGSQVVARLRAAGKAGRGFRAGYHLCPDHRQGRWIWSDWIGRAYAGGRVPTAYSRKSEPSQGA